MDGLGGRVFVLIRVILRFCLIWTSVPALPGGFRWNSDFARRRYRAKQPLDSSGHLSADIQAELIPSHHAIAAGFTAETL